MTRVGGVEEKILVIEVMEAFFCHLVVLVCEQYQPLHIFSL